MMTAVKIVEGWTSPLRFVLKADGIPVDLTGATATLILRKLDGGTIDTASDIAIDADQTANVGQLIYSPDSTDIIAANSPLRARFRVVDFVGNVAFFPNGEADVWEIRLP